MFLNFDYIILLYTIILYKNLFYDNPIIKRDTHKCIFSIYFTILIYFSDVLSKAAFNL